MDGTIYRVLASMGISALEVSKRVQELIQQEDVALEDLEELRASLNLMLVVVRGVEQLKQVPGEQRRLASNKKRFALSGL